MKTILGQKGVLLLSLSALSAQAASIEFDFNTTFSGTAPDGPAPWVSALFQDVAPGTVRLTISNLNVSATEKITELYLNLNPLYLAPNLHFNFLSGSPGVSAPLPSLGTDSFKADGDGKYDILFQFGLTPNLAFTTGDYLSYDITGIPNLTATDFGFLSMPAGGHGPFYSAIHVQGITASGTTDDTTYSGWVAPSEITVVPEPSAAAMSGLLMGLGLLSWRLRRASAPKA